MEKRRPHYALSRIKEEFSTVETLNITVTARKAAFQLRFTLQDVVDIIQEMTGEHFYKSMTSELDHAVWQDVYYVPCCLADDEEITLYVKFTQDNEGHLLISFKEKE